MRIINLVENTEGRAGCGIEHGLSFYIETECHKLLMDTGQTDLLIKNAEKLGIDLTKVDTVVLSHGHYDHGGGILPFAEINPDAKIYVSETAFGEYYSVNKAGEPHYIGLEKEIQELPQVVVVGREQCEEQACDGNTESAEEHKAPAAESDGIYHIDDELSIFSGIGNEHRIPSTNRRLKKKTDEGLVQDDFDHEQCLVIREGSKSVLLSGCAHHGILNILDRYYDLYGDDPDVVISGFHMMRKNGYPDEDINMIIETALELRRYRTMFYTGHCTGTEPYDAMKKIMGGQLQYVHSGDEIKIRTSVESITWNPAERADPMPEDAANTEAEPKSAAAADADAESKSGNTGGKTQTTAGYGIRKLTIKKPVRPAAGSRKSRAKKRTKKRHDNTKLPKALALGAAAFAAAVIAAGAKRD